MFFSLKKKTAFITGGCSGIGLAVAKRFIAAGAEVIIADLQNPNEVAQEIGASFVQTHVASEEQVKNAFEQAEAAMGKLDIIINNAGVGDLPGTLAEGDLSTWKKVFSVNVFGVWNGLKYGPKHMNNGGSIINTASQAAFTKLPAYEPYASSKSAVISLTQSAALELGERQIRVNAVCPTHTRTPMMESGGDEDTAIIRACSPMGRVAETDDLIGTYHFLAADESRFISGQSIVVDGGWTAGISEGVLNAIFK